MHTEEPGGVGPGVNRQKTGVGGQSAKLGDRIFVGISGVDQLILTENDRLSGNPGNLIGETANVDFDAPFGLVVGGDVLKPVDRQIAVELPVDPLEKVQVEPGGDAGAVVVGSVQDLQIFLEVDTDQHLGAGAEDARVVGEE